MTAIDHNTIEDVRTIFQKTAIQRKIKRVVHAFSPQAPKLCYKVREL